MTPHLFQISSRMIVLEKERFNMQMRVKRKKRVVTMKDCEKSEELHREIVMLQNVEKAMRGRK